jgi:hypothetical protein
VQFSQELRDDVLAGEITVSFRLWKRPKVKAGGRYPVGPGRGTAENVSALGLANVLAGKVNPVGSEAQAIVSCSDYVRGLPQQINQRRPSSPQSWNSFANTAECYNAFRGAASVLDVGEATVLDDVAAATTDFFEEVLPRIVSLFGEALFG